MFTMGYLSYLTYPPTPFQHKENDLLSQIFIESIPILYLYNMKKKSLYSIFLKTNYYFESLFFRAVLV